MRRLQREKKGKKRKPRKKTQPLAEGIRKGKRWPNGFFSKMSDDGLVEWAKRYMEENSIKRKIDLKKRARGLFAVLRKRNLIDNLVFKEGRRLRGFFKKMSDDGLVQYTKNFIKEKKIKSRKGLGEEDGSLYYVLCRRKVLDRLEFEGDERAWSKYSDDKLVEYAKNLVRENKIESRNRLAKEDLGLYQVLLRRKLLDRLELDGDRRILSRYSDDKLVEYAKNLVRENKIESRNRLAKENSSLYYALRIRNLLDFVFFDTEKKGERRNWASMSDEELVEYAREFVRKKGLLRRSELAEADCGLYNVLLQRKLIDRIGIETTRRDWASMSDRNLITHAKRFVSEKSIERRKDLETNDLGLYKALLKRKLLDVVFAPLDSERKREAIQEVVDAMKEFDSS